MRRIGIAGYMGAGKSLAAAALAEQGALVVDADAEAKELMNTAAPVQRELVRAFGASVVVGGRVDSVALGAMVFSDERYLRALNAIVHPPLLQRLEKKLTSETKRDVVLDAALLPLWRRESLFDLLVWVHAPRAQRLERLLARTRLERRDIERRMDLQQQALPEPSSAAWVRLVNDNGAERLRQSVVQLVNGAAHG